MKKFLSFFFGWMPGFLDQWDLLVETERAEILGGKKLIDPDGISPFEDVELKMREEAAASIKNRLHAREARRANRLRKKITGSC